MGLGRGPAEGLGDWCGVFGGREDGRAEPEDERCGGGDGEGGDDAVAGVGGGVEGQGVVMGTGLECDGEGRDGHVQELHGLKAEDEDVPGDSCERREERRKSTLMI